METVSNGKKPRGRRKSVRSLEDVLEVLRHRKRKYGENLALTTGEVAIILQIAPRTVNQAYDKGKFKDGYRINEHDRRIPLKSLMEFCKTNGRQDLFQLLSELSSLMVVSIGGDPSVDEVGKKVVEQGIQKLSYRVNAEYAVFQQEDALNDINLIEFGRWLMTHDALRNDTAFVIDCRRVSVLTAKSVFQYVLKHSNKPKILILGSEDTDLDKLFVIDAKQVWEKAEVFLEKISHDSIQSKLERTFVKMCETITTNPKREKK